VTVIPRDSVNAKARVKTTKDGKLLQTLLYGERRKELTEEGLVTKTHQDPSAPSPGGGHLLVEQIVTPVIFSPTTRDERLSCPFSSISVSIT
jgi:hypothetical protein